MVQSIDYPGAIHKKVRFTSPQTHLCCSQGADFPLDSDQVVPTYLFARHVAFTPEPLKAGNGS